MTSLGLFTSEAAVSGVAQVGNAVPGTFKLISCSIEITNRCNCMQ